MHGRIEGKETVRSGHYPEEMCRILHESMELWWRRQEKDEPVKSRSTQDEKKKELKAFEVKDKEDKDKEDKEEETRKRRINVRRNESMAEHERNDHLYFGGDCQSCVEGSGRAKAHHRQYQPEIGSLSFDMAGPIEKGNRKETYFLLGALTVEADKEGKLNQEEAVAMLGEEAAEEGDLFGIDDPLSEAREP